MTTRVHPQIKGSIEAFDFCESELVIALVYAVGTDYKPVQVQIEQLLAKHGYRPNVIRISDLIESLSDRVLRNDSEYERVSSRMDAGNAICRDSGRRDIWALAAIAEINKMRGKVAGQKSLPRTAHLILSLKRPEEVFTLRKVYDNALFVVGVFSTEKERLESLIEKNAPKRDAISLIKRDEEEIADDDGQKTRETFQLSDVFVQLRMTHLRMNWTASFDLYFPIPMLRQPSKNTRCS